MHQHKTIACLGISHDTSYFIAKGVHMGYDVLAVGLPDPAVQASLPQTISDYAQAHSSAGAQKIAEPVEVIEIDVDELLSMSPQQQAEFLQKLRE